MTGVTGRAAGEIPTPHQDIVVVGMVVEDAVASLAGSSSQFAKGAANQFPSRRAMAGGAKVSVDRR